MFTIHKYNWGSSLGYYIGLALFFSNIECKYKERWMHYGVAIESVAWITDIVFYSSFVPLTISTALLYSSME